MTSQDMIELLDCAHLSNYVQHPLPDRGGIFLVGPPETFKTSILDKALKPYDDTLVVSDLNVQTLSRLHGDFNRERYCTLAFREFSKLFERDPRTAGHLLGIIRGLAAEGFKTTSFQDPRMASTPARALVVGCMTESFYKSHFSRWEEDGFLRRFIWFIYSAKNVYKATDALLSRELYSLDGIPRRYPGHQEIPYNIDESEKRWLKSMLKDQRGETTPVLLLSKILSVLKWKYAKKDPTRPHAVLNEIASCFTSQGGILIL